MIRMIPLNKLVASPRNVRRASDPSADLELKADIEARGLLQNLLVTAISKPRGSFAVVGGERRRNALQRLAEEGRLKKDHEVSCLVIGSAEAEESSLAENFQRLAMNPADECLAFQKLIEQGSEPQDIARRFGLTIRFVEGRLRLAGLHPFVFEALGAGRISLEVAKAYAATPDQERQAYVFAEAGSSYMGDHPDSIRRMMTQSTVPAGDRRALFVGESAYLAAGGRIERDLFSEEADARWLDVALVERLAAEKLEAVACCIAAELEFAFVRPTLEPWVGWASTEGLKRVTIERTPLTEEEKAQVEALEAEMDTLTAILEDEEEAGAALADAEAKIRELSARACRILDKPPLVPEELHGKAGTFLLLDSDGQPKLHNVFYVEADGDDGTAAHEAASTSGPPAKARPSGLSRRLVDELAIQRRDILAVHVAADPGFALDLATFLMADRCNGYSSERRGSSLAALPPPSPLPGFEAPEASAVAAAHEAAERLDRSWAEAPTMAERFDLFRGLADERRSAWLGHVLARTLEASLNLPGERRCAFHDHLGSLLGIEVANWWRPTARNFFDRVPKAMMLEALREVGGPELAHVHAKSRKAELAQACERIFAGDLIAGTEVKRAALEWLPEAMRFAQLPAEPDRCPDAGDDEPAPWEDEPRSGDTELGEAA